MLKAGLRNILYLPTLNTNKVADKITNSKVDSKGRLSLKSTMNDSTNNTTQSSNIYKQLKKQFNSAQMISQSQKINTQEALSLLDLMKKKQKNLIY